jgi:hypothetical protein
MISNCALDESGLRQQLERYGRIGEGARIVDREREVLVMELDPRVDPKLVGEATAIERECCPYFTLDWEAERRHLTISVSEAELQPALDAIAFALGIETSTVRRALSVRHGDGPSRAGSPSP